MIKRRELSPLSAERRRGRRAVLVIGTWHASMMPSGGNDEETELDTAGS
jgi:hypothetical protein